MVAQGINTPSDTRVKAAMGITARARTSSRKGIHTPAPHHHHPQHKEFRQFSRI